MSNAVQSVLITGATGGMGRAIATAYAQRHAKDGGIRLALAASREGQALDQLVADMQALGAQATGLVADVTDAAQC